jgi:transcriptional regulator with XRE-family HTH domain
MANRIRFHTNPEFASALGMHPTMVSRMRNGHRSPSLETFARIVDVLQVTPKEAMAGLVACVAGGPAQATWFAKYVAAGGTKPT